MNDFRRWFDLNDHDEADRFIALMTLAYGLTGTVVSESTSMFAFDACWAF